MKGKYVIGFLLPDGTVELDPQTSKPILEAQDYFKVHYDIFANARIYELVETMKP